ncbi:hypothetical protein H4582DRAFT_1513772 [Lactarius indigo]|nr:hypothetical protein H4582DRAFT_1513772 [Lactarius indigo]
MTFSLSLTQSHLFATCHLLASPVLQTGFLLCEAFSATSINMFVSMSLPYLYFCLSSTGVVCASPIQSSSEGNYTCRSHHNSEPPAGPPRDMNDCATPDLIAVADSYPTSAEQTWAYYLFDHLPTYSDFDRHRPKSIGSVTTLALHLEPDLVIPSSTASRFMTYMVYL